MADLEFTAGMYMRARARRSRSDQIDRHMIGLAAGISYSELGAMPRRDLAKLYLSQLIAEAVPERMRIAWLDDLALWSVRLCECECECDECFMVLECGACECDGAEIIQFREVLENDMERARYPGIGNEVDYPKLVEMVTNAKDLRGWRFKRYKTIETAVTWSLANAPLSGILD